MVEEIEGDGRGLKVFPGILLTPTAQFPKFRVVLVVDGKYQFTHSEWHGFDAANTRANDLNQYKGFSAKVEDIGEDPS